MYEIFEQLLKERGMSIAEFSRQTGISKSTLSDWKNGKFRLKDDKRRKIADFFGVSLDYLDGLTDEKAETGGFFLDRSLYDVASRLSSDMQMLELFERASADSEFRNRLLQIVQLLGGDK